MVQRKTLALVIGAALAAMLGLAACGGSPAASSAASSSAQGSATASAAASASSSSAASSSASSSSASKTIDFSDMAAYKGADEAGNSVFLAFSVDDAAAADLKGALVVALKDGGFKSYLGKLDMPSDDKMTISDMSTSSNVTVNIVNPTELGGIIIESSETGTVELEPTDPQDVLEVLDATGLYGDSVK